MASPNVVLVLVDDMGFSDIGCYGGEVRTPNLDRLARGGVRFSQFYSTARCSPSRASLLTGLHPHQTGIGILTNDDRPRGYSGTLNPRCVTIAEALKSRGYATCLAGKRHLSQPAQVAYGKADGIPVRSDVLSSDLAKDPMNRWMPPYLEALKTAKQELGYQEGAQVEAVLGLKLNQALIGELSSGKALNQAAQEIKAIFEKSGRKTGVGAALAE